MEVAKGVSSLKVPVPFPLKFVNLYLLSGNGRYALVDCGPRTPETKAYLQQTLPWDRIDYIIITHHHVDHYGMAGEIKRLTKARIIMSEKEASCVDYYFRPERDDSATEGLINRTGLPEDKLAAFRGRRKGIFALVSYAPVDIKVSQECSLPEEFSAWRVIFTPGHSPGHLCLYREEDKVLISGDHLLLEITPNISLSATSSPNPLSDYLGSLQRSMVMRTNLVLPAHGPIFQDAAARAREIYDHHGKRKSDLLALMESQGLSAYQLSHRLFGEDLDTMEEWFALGETLAHLEMLCGEGLVKKTESNGKILYLLEGSS